MFILKKYAYGLERLGWRHTRYFPFRVDSFLSFGSSSKPQKPTCELISQFSVGWLELSAHFHLFRCSRLLEWRQWRRERFLLRFERRGLVAPFCRLFLCSMFPLTRVFFVLLVLLA